MRGGVSRAFSLVQSGPCSYHFIFFLRAGGSRLSAVSGRFFALVPAPLPFELGKTHCRRIQPAHWRTVNDSKRTLLQTLVQGAFKNGSRRREEADFSSKNTSASLPRRL